jgi:hypothetical protein
MKMKGYVGRRKKRKRMKEGNNERNNKGMRK